MEKITWKHFESVEIRVGTITEVQDFPEARKPAFKLSVDFGEFGIKRSSAQITTLYTKEQLLGRQVICVLNFPTKQIGPFTSEILVTGLYGEEGEVILIGPDRKVKNGLRLG